MRIHENGALGKSLRLYVATWPKTVFSVFFEGTVRFAPTRRSLGLSLSSNVEMMISTYLRYYVR